MKALGGFSWKSHIGVMEMGGCFAKIMEKLWRLASISIKSAPALTEHVFLSSPGSCALSACHFRVTRYFERTRV